MNGDENGDLLDHVNTVSFIRLTIIIVYLSGRVVYTAVQHACSD